MERDEKREYLISLRESTGMTRKDFAIEYEIPYPTITDWELGHRRVPEYFLRLLAYQVGLRNNDCCFVSGKNWFRYRTGAIIIEDNKVLFATDDTIDYYYTVGGGVHLGESSEDCIRREVFEETGVNYEVDHLAVIVENFFDGHGGKIEGMDCHCLEFYFLMKSRGSIKLDSHSTNAIGAIEHMKWIPLEDIEQYNIKPSFLKERLKEIINSDKVLHIVSEADRAYKYTLSKNELNFPAVIYDYLKGTKYNINDVGMSDSQVYMFDKYVLKVQQATAETDNEYAVLKWISGRCPTPMILEYVKEKNKAYTLMNKAVGKMLCDDEYMRKPLNLVSLVAKGLKLLWNVDLDNVEPETFGPNGFKNPLELIEWLENNQPEEDLVLSHGDFCLPNIFTDGENITAFIDNGKMGPADRWQDIAIVLRSLKSNFSGKYTGGVAYEGYEEDMLLKELGISMDEKKYRYYLLLDELF